MPRKIRWDGKHAFRLSCECNYNVTKEVYSNTELGDEFECELHGWCTIIRTSRSGSA